MRVPSSTANLGPGYDVLAAALSPSLELEVEETGEFAVECDVPGVSLDRDNLCVRAFELLHPADGFSFRIRSAIPVAAGLGSSAAAIVAGLTAADHLFELDAPLLEHALSLEGHPDNVAAALYGGFVICVGAEEPGRLEPPPELEGVVAIPPHEVLTAEARAAMPTEVPLGDAVHNVAHASLLVLGLARGDLSLIGRGLADALHQPHRRKLYPESMELVERAGELGALGASISGAGPDRVVLVPVGADRCRDRERARRRARRGGAASDLRRRRSGRARAVSERVQAAGGVVLDSEGRVALVHRPRYDDWSLPKGKLDPGESFEQAALREVEEETGLRARLVRELPSIRYSDNKGRPKVVRYWLMEVAEDPGFQPNDEVDELRWLEPVAALASAQLRARPPGAGGRLTQAVASAARRPAHGRACSS